jgi:methylphosphotriester-DNA--protein-cysteine methyltransferase
VRFYQSKYIYNLPQISNTTSSQEEIILLQKFLSLNAEDLIFDFCIDKITTSKGKVAIKELEGKTGYSSRWLNMKFMDKLGISPKNLASIVRFKHYYQGLIAGNNNPFLKNDYYEFYYDQSHFIKDFKRFTGLPPTKYLKQINDFGEIYYIV